MNKSSCLMVSATLTVFMTLFFLVASINPSLVTTKNVSELKGHHESSYQSILASYNLTFGESGLARGTYWSVTVYNHTTGKLLVTRGTTGLFLNFKLPNATYKYIENPVTGYSFGLGGYPSGDLPVNESTGYGIGYRWIPVFFVRHNPPGFFPVIWNPGIGIMTYLITAGIIGVSMVIVTRHRREGPQKARC